MSLNLNDRVALQMGRLNIANLEAGAVLDEHNAALDRAWGALAASARAGTAPDLEKLKAADQNFAAWLSKQAP